MEIEVSREEDIVIVKVSGKLDALSGPNYERQVRALIDTTANRLVIDCDRLIYVSSAGLRALLNITKPVLARGGRMVYCGLQDAVQEVFEMTGLLSVFTVCASLPEAVEQARTP